MKTIAGQLVDIAQRRIHPVELSFENGKIISIVPNSKITASQYILPGFIDAHVHIESSMLVPSEFAKLAVVHGTVATISDPHEIANVCGIEGVEFMINNSKTVPFKFNFGAPSCVPATTFETAGAALNSEDVKKLLERKEIKYLSEMMNFPGVLHKDPEVLKKIEAAKQLQKPVDGHAPGLRGEQVKQYIDAGISTDHECFTAEEALDKLSYGMNILIREGSAAKNFEALIGLLNDYPEKIMFCSDDKHPDSLVSGHINQLCARAAAKGIDIFKIVQAACVNPVHHYKLDVGLLRRGDPADFIVVKDLVNFEVLQTYISGQLVAENGTSAIVTKPSPVINQFNCKPVETKDLKCAWQGEDQIEVIEALDGQLITNKYPQHTGPLLAANNNELVSNPSIDILKIVVVNRYFPSKAAVAFIKNFGFKKGAIASSVAHDSHNIVAVGADDNTLSQAINLVIDKKGGISCVSDESSLVLALPVAGLMSNEDGYTIAEHYTTLDAMAKSLGSGLAAPFMTLSFMALLVIPHLKLSDKGLFDGDSFQFA